ncbi:MAG: DUF2098 domain-containing protein [Thermoprotei archaeon]|nr:MAG: DUF2098 domain-containing protein [Thermoprotei archaeon]RLF19295.1 MAG: DUF2098 domain-containing protein [Thermoprotei archaeon]
MGFVVNKRGFKIAIGMPVRYVRTGSMGIVKAIDLLDGRYWALLDPLNLYYDIDCLEPIESLELKEKERKGKVTIEEVLREEAQLAERATEVTPSGAG